MTQHFPTTHATTIVEATRSASADALAAVAARIIERYAQPLEAYAQPLEAYAQVEQALIAEGPDRAWRVVHLNVLDGVPYGGLERDFALSRPQMANLVRGVTARLRTRIRELLDEEGRFGEDGVDEIVRLLSERRQRSRSTPPARSPGRGTRGSSSSR